MDKMEEVVFMFSSLKGGDIFVVMICGAETHWWTLGEAADVLFKTLPMRRFMATNYDDTQKQGQDGKAQKIAQDFLSLSSEPVLLCDLALLKCYHRFYLARHLKYFQSKDYHTRKAAFQALNVFVRCFLMEEDYFQMMHSWRTMPEFADVVSSLNSIPEADVRALGEKKITMFFTIAFGEHKKMFTRWLQVDKLAFLAAFAEVETGKIVCQRMLGIPLQENDDICFESKAHERPIHLGRFAAFVTKSIPEPAVSISKLPHIVLNSHLIAKISSGFNIWDYKDPMTESYGLEISERYGAFFSNNQGAERANKDQNLATLNQRKGKKVLQFGWQKWPVSRNCV